MTAPAPPPGRERDAVEVHSSQAGLFADRYQTLGADPYASSFAYSRKRLHEAIQRSLPPSAGRLLDVGCGTGHQLATMRARGFEVTGIDGSDAMLDHARRLNPGVDLHRSGVESLPLEDESFDVVLCLEVLRYLPSIDRCVSEMARVLRPGGVCLATASPLFNLNGYPVLNRMVQVVPVGRLVRLRQHFHTSSGLVHVFRKEGFAEVRAQGVYCGLINWIEWLAPSVLPGLLQALERMDARVSDGPVLRDLSGMLLVHAVR